MRAVVLSVCVVALGSSGCLSRAEVGELGPDAASPDVSVARDDAQPSTPPDVVRPPKDVVASTEDAPRERPEVPPADAAVPDAVGADAAPAVDVERPEVSPADVPSVDAAEAAVEDRADAGVPPSDRACVATDETCDGADNDCDGMVDEGLTRPCYSGPPGTADVGACRAGTSVCTAGSWGACGAGVLQITELGATGCAAVEHGATSGDDRGGIAVSSASVFYTGDRATAALPLDLTAQTSVGRQYDALTSNLRSGQVYTLANGTTPLAYGGGTVTALLAIDPVTGALTGASVMLSAPVSVGANSGIFAGFDRVVLHDGATRQVYSVALPTGAVTNVGTVAAPPRTGCESWAVWGVAESFGGTLYETYVANATTVERMALPSGARTTVATFSNLSDLCSFSVSLATNRWYFHHEGTSQFRAGEETVGYCSAAISVGGGSSEVLPSTETCDGVDNNCNGSVDEGVTRECYRGPLGTAGVGRCRRGAQSCRIGAWSADCVGEVLPVAEVCDGADNNCNGMVDEGLSCSP